MNLLNCFVKIQFEDDIGEQRIVLATVVEDNPDSLWLQTDKRKYFMLKKKLERIEVIREPSGD